MKKCLTSAIILACATFNASLLHADDAENTPWRPAPPKKDHPYPVLPKVEYRKPERLSTMTIDGTFESYKLGESVTTARDDKDQGMFFLSGTFERKGPDNGVCVYIPGGNGPTIGFEEKNIPFKPNTWYRLQYAVKGVPYMMQFSYPREAPKPDGDNDGKEYMNTIYVDNSFGGGYGFCYVCSECKFVKNGGQDDGAWITGGFKELPEKCPECGAEGSLFNECDRQAYMDWKTIHTDFRTGDYVGLFHNVPYYWLFVFIGSGSNTSVANLMVYEITEEGGAAVGGDTAADAKPADAD